MLAQRRRRWANIKAAFGQRLVFVRHIVNSDNMIFNNTFVSKHIAPIRRRNVVSAT